MNLAGIGLMIAAAVIIVTLIPLLTLHYKAKRDAKRDAKKREPQNPKGINGMATALRDLENDDIKEGQAGILTSYLPDSEHFAIYFPEKGGEHIFHGPESWFLQMFEIEQKETRKYDRPLNLAKVDEYTDEYDDFILHSVSEWNDLVNKVYHNHDGSGYWAKDGMASRDEVFGTPQLDATHVIWYPK